MSDRLQKQIGVEREQISLLLDQHRSLLQKCSSEKPTPIERSALAAMLHCFYTGIENIFKRIAVECDEHPPRGGTWHSDLLGAMAEPTQIRPATISPELRDRLREYLNFRHVFRHAYSFNLRWEKMAHLVLECEKTWSEFEAQVKTFLERLREGQA